MDMMKEKMKMMNSELLMPSLYTNYTTRIRNNMIKRNQNWICVIVGKTGHGKSYVGAKLAQDIDPTFIDSIRDEGLKSRVSVGNKDDFLAIVKKARNKEMKKGSMIIFDEAGVTISCRTWFEQNQQALMNILQSFRILNIGTIFTTPNLSFIDAQARKLIHEYLKALRINYNINRVILKPFYLDPDTMGDKIYTKYHWFHGIKMTRLVVAKPSKDFITPYEPEKEVLLDTLIEEAEISSKIEKIRDEQRKVFDSDIMRRIKEEQIPLDAYTLQFKFNIGKDRAYRIIANYEKFSLTL